MIVGVTCLALSINSYENTLSGDFKAKLYYFTKNNVGVVVSVCLLRLETTPSLAVSRGVV